MNILKNNLALSILSFILIFLIANVTYGSLWGNQDEALLKAVQSDNFKHFKRLLKMGANPNAISTSDKDPEDWVMCEVTNRGRLDFLTAAMKYGGDINIRNEQASNAVASIFSAPLLCAITHNNLEAFKFLLENKVDSDIAVCLSCDIKYLQKPTKTAANKREYEMVYMLIEQKGQLSEKEVTDLIFSINNYPINPNSEAKQWQLKVIDWLRKQGHEVEPWTIEKIKKKRK